MPDKTLTKKFMTFLNETVPWFQCDQQCLDVVIKLGYYTLGDEKFEKDVPAQWTKLKVKHAGPTGEQEEVHFQTDIYLEKGILLFGNFGTGKTDLLNLLGQYFISINSPEMFRSGVVWKFGNLFTDKGFDALKPLEKRCNWFLDELGLKTEAGEFKEWAFHYSTKVLIGSEIIRIRHELFKNWGIKTHFTTNMTPTEIRETYGGQAWSRLVQMCNFIPLIGKDRRLSGRPNFFSKAAARVQPYQPVNQEEVDIDRTEFLKEYFEQYKQSRSADKLSSLHYDLLLVSGIEICTEQEFQKKYVAEAKEKRKSFVINSNMPETRSARVDYNLGKISDDERARILSTAKKNAVVDYFNRLLEQGKELFQEENQKSVAQ